MYLTRNELEIMDVMWEAGKPLSRGELMTRAVDKSWKSSSIHILLNSMLSKGAIFEAGFAKCGKTCGRTYAPTVTVEEYYISTLDSTGYRPGTVKLFEAAADRLGLSAADIDESLRILEKAEKN